MLHLDSQSLRVFDQNLLLFVGNEEMKAWKLLDYCGFHRDCYNNDLFLHFLLAEPGVRILKPCMYPYIPASISLSHLVVSIFYPVSSVYNPPYVTTCNRYQLAKPRVSSILFGDTMVPSIE